MKTFFKLSLAITLVGMITLGFLGSRVFSTPSTAEMEKFFSNHKRAFEEKNKEILTELSQQETISSTGDLTIGYQWLEVDPTPENEQQNTPTIIRYYTHRKGIGVSSFGTGIAYIDPRREERIYPNLEAMREERKRVERFIGYSRISGDWYSFLWEAD